MPDAPATCSRCGGAFVAGFLFESDAGVEQRQLRWVAGEARRGLTGFAGGEAAGLGERYRVTTHRCAGCGALESFARERA